jgi:hypothetical protein
LAKLVPTYTVFATPEMLPALAQENLNLAERAAVPVLIRCDGTAQSSEPRFREALGQTLSCVKHDPLAVAP